MDESEILSLIRENDDRGVALLMEKYEKRVFNYVYYRVGTLQDAEDITAETFLRFVQNARNLRSAKILPYLIRIAHNLVCDFHRRRPRTLRLLPNLKSNSNPTRDVEVSERMIKLREALQLLSPRDREVFMLYYFEKLSLKEVARIVRVTENNAKVILHRARKKIKKALEGDEGK